MTYVSTTADAGRREAAYRRSASTLLVNMYPATSDKAMLLKPLPPVIMIHLNRLIHHQRGHLLRPFAVPGAGLLWRLGQWLR